MSKITAGLMVCATLIAVYMGWAIQRISTDVLGSDDPWPRSWPYPDGWLFAWERKLEATRRYYPIDYKGRGQIERLEVRVRRLAWCAGGLAAVNALLWMLACWRFAFFGHRLTGVRADYADGLVPGLAGLAPSGLARAWDCLGVAIRHGRRTLIRPGLPAGLVTGLTLAGLSLWPDKAAEPTPPVPITSIQASFFHLRSSYYSGDSGWAFWARADGTAILQEVSPALVGEWEKRYQFALTTSQMRELERLLGQHDFLRLGERLRPRDNRERTMATVWAVLPSGQEVSIRVNRPQDHPDFHAVFEYLQGLWIKSARGEPVYVGPFKEVADGF
jgi:hypothetical protein